MEHPTTLTRERRVELLASAPSAALIALAERAIAEGPEPNVISGPEVGMVMMTVREPIAQERFHLGEVLVTRAEVEIDGNRGWAMRMGQDRLATLAAAILDANVEADRPVASEVIDLCALAAADAQAQAAEEWAELAPTEVRFDELD